ncbi:unnamed protein product [Sympodiomycopsis kandeliae]
MRFSISSVAALTAAASLLPSFALGAQKSDFLVDGKKLPGISSVIGDVGTSYAGRLSITNNATDTDQLFFWLWPPANGAPDKDLTIWFGGGPGCSGLGGMLQEVGPFLLPDNSQGKTIVKKNPNSWTNAGWVLFLDQPGYTGFSTVAPRDDLNEAIIAKQFQGFLANLYKTFPELSSKNLYLQGESYAGQYIPHIADAIYNSTSSKIPLKGMGIYSGRYLPDQFQVEIPYYQYILNRQKDLDLNSTVIQMATKRANELGLVGFVDKALQYPPKGPIVAPKKFLADKGDPLSFLVNPILLEDNQCFDYYNIRAKCPTQYNPLSQQNNFLENTKGFRKAIHLSEDDTWKSCTRPSYIFPKGDSTPFSMQDGSLARSIDKSTRSLIINGQDDFKLLSLGTQLGLQNTTWGGKQGFQTNPTTQAALTGASGKKVGTYHTERKLTFALVDNAGHFVSVTQPEASLKLHKYLLGQIDEASLGK